MTPNSKTNTPTQTLSQAKKFLITFYQKPIAQVSSELIFTISATIFFAIFAIRPTIITMTDLVKEIREKRETLGSLEKKLAALASAQSSYFVLQNRFYLLDETLNTRYDFRDLVASIEKSASENQLAIGSIQIAQIPQSVSDQPVFEELEVQPLNIVVGANGTYDQIRAFLKKITQLRPLIDIDSISLVSGLNQQVSDNLTVTIRLKAYFFGEPKIDINPDPDAVDEASEETTQETNVNETI